MTNSHTALLSGMLFVLCVRTCAATDVPEIAKAAVGRGPALFFIQPDSSSGHRREALYVADPAAPAPAQRVLTVDGNLRVLARVDAARFLVQLFGESGGLFLVDLAEGKARKLDPAGRPDFLGIVGRQAWFVSSARPAEYGYKIKDGAGGPRVASQPHPSQVLYSAALDVAGEAKAVGDDDVARVLELRDGECWAVVNGPTPELRRIPLAGGPSTLALDLGADAMPELLTQALSPSGNLLAVGIARTGDPFDHRALVAVDLRTRKTIFSLPEIATTVSPLSSQMPYLEMTWVDENTLRFSETQPDASGGAARMSGSFVWVDLEVKTGKRLRERRYSGLELRHTKPPADDALPADARTRIALGEFERESWRFFYAGEKEPLRDGGGQEIDAATEKAFSPDGRWLAVAAKDSSEVAVMDGLERRTRRVIQGWGYELTWMPAAP